MATTANNLSPRFSSDNNNTNTSTSNSPKSHRLSTAAAAASAAAKSASPAWTQIVRKGGGEDSEPIVTVSSTTTAAAIVQEQTGADFSPVKAPSYASSSSEEEGFDKGNSGNEGKKPVWSKPSNGDVDVVEGGLVMDAVYWPALSESAKTSSKSSSDSLKPHSDGSVFVSQGTEIAPPVHKQASNNKNHSSSQNHALLPTRQKSMKRHNAPANGGLAQPPTLPGPFVEIASSNNFSNTHKNSNWESGHRVGSGSHSHGGHDHPNPPNFVRRGNGGPYPRGDGSYNHTYGGRRDQDRANRDWNSLRRDGHIQPPGVPRSFIRPVPPPAPSRVASFISPPPMPPFVSAMGFYEFPMHYIPGPPPESLRGVPFAAPIPPHALPFPVPDPQLHTRILNQIDYYFSENNLIKDEFLRRHMDEQGWVPIRLIAGFRKITEMTDNIQLILGAIQTSTVVEVQVDKVRKRDDWRKFLIPSGQDTLADRVRNVTLEERTNNYTSTDVQANVHVEAYLSRSSSGDSNSHFQPSSGAWSAQVNVQAGSDSVVAKNTS